jgi:hypothetical protein
LVTDGVAARTGTAIGPRLEIEALPPATIVKLPGPLGPVWLWVGVILILLSFGIYFAYPLVPFLPVPMWQKGGVGIGLASVSWAMFFVGSALVGKKGVAEFKRRLSRKTASRSGRNVTRDASRRES